jgi:hypothetical protein
VNQFDRTLFEIADEHWLYQKYILNPPATTETGFVVSSGPFDDPPPEKCGSNQCAMQGWVTAGVQDLVYHAGLCF